MQQVEEVEVIENFDAGKVVNTPTTPNSNAITNPKGDVNDTTQVTLMYNNVMPCWSPIVSSSNTTVTLGGDTGNDVVTFKEGLTVTYRPQSGGNYVVVLDGTILDSGSLYKLNGKNLGIFPSKKDS